MGISVRSGEPKARQEFRGTCDLGQDAYERQKEWQYADGK